MMEIRFFIKESQFGVNLVCFFKDVASLDRLLSKVQSEGFTVYILFDIYGPIGNFQNCQFFSTCFTLEKLQFSFILSKMFALSSPKYRLYIFWKSHGSIFPRLKYCAAPFVERLPNKKQICYKVTSEKDQIIF